MDFSRRQFLSSSVATFAVASLSTPLLAADPIVIGVPTAKSGPVGVADQADWLNGVTMAVEEIHAAGGVTGRPLEPRGVDIDLLTPEGTVAAFQSLVEGGVQALAHSFAIIEELSGHRTPVQDPFLDILIAQQPPADYVAYQRTRLETQARSLGF